MTPERITSLGDELYDAWREHRTVAPLVEREPDITINHAYFIQLRFVERRVAAGERIVGKKIGVTSKAVQAMVGVSQPDFGQLTSGIVHDGGSPLQLDALIQPKAEAEVAFVLKHDLRGPGITTTDVIRATDYVVPCFEIVDSRIANWNIKIQDTIAAVQGGPVNAVVWLANTLGRLGIPFLAGEVILSGSQSALVPVAAGDTLRCTVGGLGSCEVTFAGGGA